MFTQLFFLMLVSFLAAVANDTVSPFGSGEEPEITSLLEGLAVYLTALAVLCGINKYFMHARSTNLSRILFFDNIVITSVIALFLLYFESFRYIAESLSPFVQTATIVTTLLLYFLGLYACNYSYYMGNYSTVTAQKKSIGAVQFLLPFTLPLILITAFLDLFGDSIPSTFWGMAFGLAAFVAFILATMILLPPIIVKAWKCPPLQNPALQLRLDALCEKTQFGHAGYKIWTTFEDSITAAIIGLIARFRYILFTRKLLETMPESSIEAILAHEIGHNKRKHLWLFPLITLGMLLTGGLALQALYILEWEFPDSPDAFWKFAEIAVFVAAMALYFRYIFGLFSRLFERQADLYIYEAGLDPQQLIDAFQQLARASGASETDPSWHHFSIRERVDFLRKTQQDPSLIDKHHRKVYVCLGLLVLFLIITLILTGIS